MDYEITELEKEKWQGYNLEFRYVANERYDIKIIRTSDDDFCVSLKKILLDVPYVKMPDKSDKLFQPWWDEAMAWGIVENNRLIAAIETAAEVWSNRLMVTELWVHENYRRKGIARALMNKALQRAKTERRRALILETQSCNVGAIAFYLDFGFDLIGFDSCAYQNNDLQRGEVRLDFGILLDC